MFMVELHKTVEEIYNNNLDKLEVFESEDEFELCKEINTTLKMLHHGRTIKSAETIT